MSNRQARRRRAEAVRNGDIIAKVVRQEMGRAKVEEVARHNAAEMAERNRHRDVHEQEPAYTARAPTPAPAPLPVSPRGRHITRLQMLALAMAAFEGER